MAFNTNKRTQNIIIDKVSRTLEVKTGIYKIDCIDYDSFYIGQTKRSFLKWPKKNIKINKIKLRKLFNRQKQYIYQF